MRVIFIQIDLLVNIEIRGRKNIITFFFGLLNDDQCNEYVKCLQSIVYDTQRKHICETKLDS